MWDDYNHYPRICWDAHPLNIFTARSESISFANTTVPNPRDRPSGPRATSARKIVPACRNRSFKSCHLAFQGSSNLKISAVELRLFKGTYVSEQDDIRLVGVRGALLHHNVTHCKFVFLGWCLGLAICQWFRPRVENQSWSSGAYERYLRVEPLS